MDEYIDKSAVVAKIDEFVEINKAHGFPVDIFDMEMLKKRIEQIPAADVAPVVHGKWLKAPYKYLVGTCSVCGCEPLMPSFRATPYNYCPNCGAKMDEEANDENI